MAAKWYSKSGMPTEGYLSTSQVRERKAISESVLTSAVARGELHRLRIGHGWFYHDDEIRTWVPPRPRHGMIRGFVKAPQ